MLCAGSEQSLLRRTREPAQPAESERSAMSQTGELMLHDLPCSSAPFTCWQLYQQHSLTLGGNFTCSDCRAVLQVPRRRIQQVPRFISRRRVPRWPLLLLMAQQCSLRLHAPPPRARLMVLSPWSRQRLRGCRLPPSAPTSPAPSCARGDTAFSQGALPCTCVLGVCGQSSFPGCTLLALHLLIQSETLSPLVGHVVGVLHLAFCVTWLNQL